MRRDPAFSMLETLVVLLVLSILSGALLSAVTTLRHTSEIKHARADAIALAQAIKEYRQIYGNWPNQRQGQQDRVYAGMGGESGQSNIVVALLNNPRGLLLLELPDMAVTNGCYLDPWQRPYLIAIDENGDGHLDVHVDGFLSTSINQETVGVMSYGDSTTGSDLPIRSWELYTAP